MTVHENETGQPAISDAQGAVRHFLEGTLPEVRRVDITRMAPVDSGDAAWEAEAEVWQPNATLATLGIQTQRPVLDHQRYLLRLDALLNVLAYELEGSASR
jgi:hypothetical protein